MGTTTRPRGNSVLLLRPLATVLGRLEIDGARFLASLGIDDATPADAYVPDVDVDRALFAIAKSRDDETFGLTLARAAVAHRPLGLFGNLVWLSGTLGDAISRAAHFYSLVTRRATLALRTTEDGVAALTRRVFEGAPRGPILAEYMFATLVLRAHEATGRPLAVRAMRFAHEARDAAPYRALFQAKVTFGHRDAADELTFDAGELDRPLLGADPYMVAAIESHVRKLDVHGEARPLGERVHDAALAALRAGGAPSLDGIARAVGTGPHALRRHLRDEGLSFRTVITSAQRDRAHELLAEGAPIKAVAFALGFSEPSAFSRAYKRWTGHAPSAG